MTISVNCEACGKVYSFKIEAAGQTFVCQECGNDCVVPVPDWNQPSVVPIPVGTQPSTALAIVSLVLSIISVPVVCVAWIPYLCCVFVPMSSSLALIGAITGFIGLKKVKAGTASGKGLALGGMITGIVVFVLNIIIGVVYILIFGAGAILLFELSNGLEVVNESNNY